MTPTVTAVVLAYGAEEWLEESVRGVLASPGIEADVVVVDNGCTSDAVDRVKGLPGVRVITPDSNTGYSGGCDRGALEATGTYLAFVNSDAVVTPDAIPRMVAVAAERSVGFAMGSIRIADTPELINSCGNPVHFTGLTWTGGHGEPATRYGTRRSVLGGSGCCFVIRRQLWEEVGGFADEFFAYGEDCELSLRLWQRGLTVEYVPDAVVLHHYEFSRNENKFYLVERNRAILVLTTYQLRTLIVVAPALILTEALMLCAGIAGGWGRAKIRGWQWLWQHRRWLAQRRAQLQSERVVSDAVIVARMTARFDPAMISLPPGIGLYNAAMRGYWWIARRFL